MSSSKIDKNGDWRNEKGELHREDGPAIEWVNGYKAWYLNGKLYKWSQFGGECWYDSNGEHHREDGPAIQFGNGDKYWYLNGKLHRTDGPAIELAGVKVVGEKQWYLNGKLHREDGPAVEWANEDKEWYLNGERHREDGPAVECANGTKKWYLNGQLHREDGPAIEHADGDKCWCLNDKLHREDGPAVEYKNGTKFWYLNGLKCSEQEFNEKMKSTQNTKETKMSNPKIDRHGNKRWYNEQGNFHREDGPAIEYANGDALWYLNDKLHREDGPAVEWENGSKLWYLNGQYYSEQEFNEKMKSTQKFKEMINPQIDGYGTKRWYNEQGELHREDGPAIEYANGIKKWYLNGQFHSEDDEFGNKRWYNENGQLHREDGPAIEYKCGYKAWWKNGKLHREDGPAREWANGNKEWYLNDVQCSEEQFCMIRKFYVAKQSFFTSVDISLNVEHNSAVYTVEDLIRSLENKIAELKTAFNNSLE